MLVISQYLIFPQFTLTLWKKKYQKVIIKKSPSPLTLKPTQVWIQAEIPFSRLVNRPHMTPTLPEEEHMLKCFSKSGPYFP